MEKINTREEVASRLRAKEEEINQRFEALQDEVKQTKNDVVAYVKENPWLGVAATTAVGVLVGLIIGKRSDSAKQSEILNTYARHVSEMAGNSGVSEEQVRSMLREALRETAAQAMYSVPKKKSGGLKGKLFGIVTDIAFGYLSKTVMNSVEARLSPQDPASSSSASDE